MTKETTMPLKGDLLEGNPAPNCTEKSACTFLFIHFTDKQVRGCKEVNQSKKPRTETEECPAYTPS